MWTTLGHGTGQLLRLVNNLILWRLLPAEVFGLMALVNACMVGLNMFSDVGIGPSIIQNDRGNDPKYLNTAWTIQVARQTMICVVACLLAAPVASFYGEPQLARILPAVALSALLTGFNSTRLFTAARSLSLGRLTAIDLASQVAGLALMMVGAWLYHSIWAIVAGSAVSSLTRLILGHTVLPGLRNRFCWDASSARIMLKFGRWIFVSTLLSFLVGQADRLIFGKLIPLAMLGVYGIATTWAGMSQVLANRVFDSVLFPLLSRLQHDKCEFSRRFLRARRPWLLLCGGTAACLVAGGPTLVRLLYPTSANGAGWIIQVLAGGTWVLTLEDSNGHALLAMGAPKWLAAGNAAKLIAMAIMIPVGFALFGFSGAVLGIAGSQAARYLVSVVGTRRRGISGLAQDVRLTALVVVTASGGLLVAHWIGHFLRPAAFRPTKLGTFLEAIAIFVSTGALWGMLFWRDRRRSRVPEPNRGAAS